MHIVHCPQTSCRQCALHCQHFSHCPCASCCPRSLCCPNASCRPRCCRQSFCSFRRSFVAWRPDPFCFYLRNWLILMSFTTPTPSPLQGCQVIVFLKAVGEYLEVKVKFSGQTRATLFPPPLHTVVVTAGHQSMGRARLSPSLASSAAVAAMLPSRAVMNPTIFGFE